MSSYFDTLVLGQHFTELPKSALPASATVKNGMYPFYCSSNEVKRTNVWFVDKPTVLMGTGGVASVNYGDEKFSYSTDTWGIKSCSEKLSTKYLYRIIQLNLDLIGYVAFEGSGLKHLRKIFIKKLKVQVPNESRQSRITEILDAVDSNIEQTKALVGKYKLIKYGMMQDFFTRGILPDGSLRPSREEMPELYKETSFGWIPEDWQFDQIENLLAPISNNMRSGPFGSALLKSELVEEGIPFLGIDNIHTEKFVKNFKRFVSKKKFIELNRYSVRPYDVVITIMGTVGRSCIIPYDIDKALSSKHLWSMSLNKDKVFPELVCWQLNYAPWVLAWFRRETQGGIMDAIQSKTLRTLTLPLPDINEQNRILIRYKTINEKIDTESLKLNKLVKLKTGLMNDLLLGKIRISTLNKEAS